MSVFNAVQIVESFWADVVCEFQRRVAGHEFQTVESFQKAKGLAWAEMRLQAFADDPCTAFAASRITSMTKFGWDSIGTWPLSIA